MGRWQHLDFLRRVGFAIVAVIVVVAVVATVLATCVSLHNNNQVDTTANNNQVDTSDKSHGNGNGSYGDYRKKKECSRATFGSAIEEFAIPTHDL